LYDVQQHVQYILKEGIAAHFLCINSSRLYLPTTTIIPTHNSPNNLNIVIMSASDLPTGDVVDNDYKSRTGQSEIPVQSDGAAVEATEYDNGGDSDKQLGKITALSSSTLLMMRREG
jgi:hypothetical protein